jgi:hypothetical protein
MLAIDVVSQWLGPGFATHNFATQIAAEVANFCNLVSFVFDSHTFRQSFDHMLTYQNGACSASVGATNHFGQKNDPFILGVFMEGRDVPLLLSNLLQQPLVLRGLGNVHNCSLGIGTLFPGCSGGSGLLCSGRRVVAVFLHDCCLLLAD